MLIPPMSSPVCMACVPASYVDLECKHLFESADVAAAGAQGCSCDSLVYVYLRREQDGVHCLSNLTKIKNNIGNVYSSHCVHIHHVYSSTSNIYSHTCMLNCKAGQMDPGRMTVVGQVAGSQEEEESARRRETGNQLGCDETWQSNGNGSVNACLTCNTHDSPQFTPLIIAFYFLLLLERSICKETRNRISTLL